MWLIVIKVKFVPRVSREHATDEESDLTTLADRSGWTSSRGAGTGRDQGTIARIAVAMVLPAVLTVAAIITAAIAGSAPAHADPVDGALTNVLSSVGIGNNGPISSYIAQLGQAICPLLVKPGSSLVSNATQMSGHGGIAPTITGAVAGMAIQAECPDAMTQLANGNFGPIMQLMGAANGASTSPFGLPSAGATSPFGLPSAAATSPFGLPATGATPALSLPTAASPLQLPATS
jgi:hypothetical protein